MVLRKALSKRLPVLLLPVLILLPTPLFAFTEDIKPEIAAALQGADTAQAVQLLQQEIEIDKGYHLNYYVLGLIYANQMKTSRAKEMFKTALDKKSKHWESLYQLGLCYIALDQGDSAQKVMERGRKKAKKGMQHIFENGYGLTMLKKGDYQEAEKAFLKALIDHPDNAEYLINLGDAYFYQGVPSLAITYYKKAEELAPGSTEVYYHWAEACLEMRDYNCALEKLRLVLSRDSTFANAWMLAGGIYFNAALSTRSY
ncbi:MAG: tetratricopeptide repeat protein, partial [Candidatus Zixiibacteriota bacterium]